mgnify:CR=1 FL=1
MALCALLGLKTALFTNVHMIFDNAYLMERDEKDFEDLWRLAKYTNQV